MGKNSNTNGNVSRSTSSDGKQMRSLTHHPDYWLVGGDLYIIIETTIFKIHSHFFRREAKNFFSNIDPKSPGDDTKKGQTENTAIIIDTATVKEFEKFLWVFYNPLYDIYDADISDWFSILRLAHEWDFPIVKRFALREIKRREDEIDLVQRIVLYRDFKAPPEYLVPLYAQLCSRPTSPTDEESRMLGLQETLNVFRAREMIRADGSVSPLPKGKKEQDTWPTIASVLGLPEYKPDLDPDAVPQIRSPTPKPQKNVNGRNTPSSGSKFNLFG